MDSEELLIEFMAVDHLTEVIDKIGNKLESFGKTLENMGGTVGKSMGEIAGGVGAALGVVGGLIGAGAGLFGILDHLATKTAEYALTVDRWSKTLAVGTDWLQTMYQAGSLLGVGTDQMNLAFARFAKNLEDGGIQLKAMHLTLQEVGITSTNVETAFGQLADKFHGLSDASQKLAVSTLFGRNAMASLMPILNLGREGVSRLTEEFKSFGLVLTGDQLAVDGAAKVMQDKLHLVLKGIAMTIGNALIPAFTMLWTLLGKILMPLTGAGNAADGLARALSQVVVWLVAFISAVTGVPVALGDITKSLQDNSAMLALVGGQATDAGGSLQGLAGNTKDLTQALQNQSQALTDQQNAYDESMQAQIDGQRALDVAYNRTIDDQVKTLDLQIQQLHLAEQQSAADATMAADKAAIQKAQTDLARAPYLGIADVSGPMKALADAQKKMATDVLHEQISTKVRDLEATKSTLQEQKTGYDRATTDRITGIEAVKKSHDDAFKDQIRNVQEELRATQQAQAAMKQSGLAANQALQNANNATTSGITNGMALSADAIRKMADSGSKAARELTTAFTDFGNTVGWINDRLTTFSQNMADITNFFSTLARLTKAVFGQGASLNGPQASDERRHSGDGSHATPVMMGFAGDPGPSYDIGGPVMAAPGAAVSATVHGGEYVVPQDGVLIQGGGRDDEIVAALWAILGEMRKGGDMTGVMAGFNRLMSNSDYQRSRGVMSYSAG